MNKNLTNGDIAQLFRQVAAVYALHGLEPFRIQAYLNAASSIEQFSSPVREMWEQKTLEEIPGIGEKFAKYLDELFRTGTIKRLKKILDSEPAGMYTLLDVPGIGPKTAYKLAKAFHLNNAGTAIEKVKQLALKGKIRNLMGFSETSEQKILHAIQQQNVPNHPRLLLIEAQEIARDVMEYLQLSPLTLTCEMLGSLRRFAPTVGDIDIAVATKKPTELMEYLVKFPHAQRIISAGSKMVIFMHTSGWQVDVKTQSPDRWGSMLQHYTGSKLHNIHLRTYANSLGLPLSENGIKKNGKISKYETEESFYHALGLDYIPPELREDAGEIEAARAHHLPKLIERKDVKGDFHIHTAMEYYPSSHDVGQSTVTTLLKRAMELGYEYIGFSDHNPKQQDLTARERIALVRERSEKIRAEVAEVEGVEEAEEVKERGSGTTKKIPRVFLGLEVDILPDGNIALEEEAFDYLDYAIVSIHSQFQLERSEMTRRILKALDHEKVKIWGHPTARRLQRRSEINCDWQEIFAFCAQHQKYIEINGSPSRIDLPAPLIREAHNAGVKFLIDTDSHHVDHLNFMQYGVGEARRGWLEASEVLNTLPAKEFEKVFLQK